MTTILFRPFDIGKWFALGFTAWIAHLLGGGGSSGGGGGGTGDGSGDWGSIRDFFIENLEWIIAVAVTLFVVISAIVIVLLWVESRGKFLFLDNIAKNLSRVTGAWSAYRAQGNSLFRWRLVFTIATTVLVLVMLGGIGYSLYAFFETEIGMAGAIPAIVLGLLFIAVVIAVAYISLLLEDFVVPLQFRYGGTTRAAWRRFLPLHNEYALNFVLYALWKTLLGFVSTAAIFALALLTCCIAALVMAIPYLGAVLLLPVYTFYRSLGPEFLRQFGEEYQIWDDLPEPVPSDPPLPPGHSQPA